jgi:cell division protein FtsI (penicillin-binding protein 3)
MLLEKSINISNDAKQLIERGNIYDRNGNLLSTTINSYSLSANPKSFKNKKLISEKLSLIISRPKEEIRSLLNENKSFVWLKRNISPKEHQAIIDLGEVYLKTEHIKEEEIKRIYPYGNISSHVVGYVDIDGNGLAGIERGLNKILSKGEDVHLSIDVRLQNAFREELIKTINKFSADSGSIVAIDITTGEIMALSSFPDFDPNNRKTFTENNKLNRIIGGNYEMGSTFKPITVAMGIDKKIIKPESSFDVSKPIKRGKITINDFHSHKGFFDIKEIVVNSSNIGAAKIARKIGKKNQINFFKKLGFYEKIELEIIESAKPYTNPNHWGEIETMTIGYGHGFMVTPLHLVSAYASLINDGKRLNPTFIKDNIVINKTRIIKHETSDYFIKLLRAVVLETEYTGPRVKIEGYEIGGKTGTAELINESGLYQKDMNLTSFIGVFPASRPKYIVLAMIENPKKIKEENYNITGASVAAPLVKNIISRMIEILSIPRSNSVEILKADISDEYIMKNNATF